MIVSCKTKNNVTFLKKGSAIGNHGDGAVRCLEKQSECYIQSETVNIVTCEGTPWGRYLSSNMYVCGCVAGRKVQDAARIITLE